MRTRYTRNPRPRARRTSFPHCVSRILIEQSKGVLLALTSNSVDEAFRLMREYSRRNRIPLREVAAQVIARTITPDQLLRA
jgi:hypothetical protein